MKYEKEQLQQTNIYCLRNIAREVGVKSPTSLKKQRLIDEIMQILSGEKKPCNPTKTGRPVKNAIDTLDCVTKNDLSLPIKNEKIKKEIINAVLKEVEKRLNEIL